jgi:hypothetical protein
MADELFFWTVDSRSQVHKVSRASPASWCLVIHPKPVDSTFRSSHAMWFSTRPKAEREAAYWVASGYRVELIEAIEIQRREWFRMLPQHLVVRKPAPVEGD